MKFSSRRSFMFVSALCLMLGTGLFLAGCMTSKVSTVSGDTVTGFTTNTTTVVNEANLMLDCAGIQSLTAVSVSLLVGNNPGLAKPLEDAHTALDGILNGTNPQTQAQVIAMLKAQGNASLTAEITSLQASVSQLEQDLLKKYGATVGGEIMIAITKAVDRGIVVGLIQTPK